MPAWDDHRPVPEPVSWWAVIATLAILLLAASPVLILALHLIGAT